MLREITMIATLVTTSFASIAFAQAPASAPTGSSGLCRDGSYWTGAVKRGACRGHQGVQEWYGATDAATSAVAPATAVPAAPSAAPAPPAAPAPAVPASAGPSVPVHKTMAIPTAVGGGPGLVWVNSNSKVYHCQSDRWYGKTKSGEYMSEADALAKGNRADHGKACK